MRKKLGIKIFKLDMELDDALNMEVHIFVINKMIESG